MVAPIVKNRSNVPTSVPAPDEREQTSIQDAAKRVIGRRPRVQVTAEAKKGTLVIGAPHTDQVGYAARLRDAFGTTSAAFMDQGIGRLGAVMRRRGADLPTEKELNAALAVVDGLQPRDETEAMLAVQMAATHEVAMEMLTRAKQAEYVPTLQTCGSLAVKLLRTYTAQVEALAKLRRGGEQKVTVEHVHVHAGGQAIVGTVSHPGGGRGGAESEGQAHAPEEPGALPSAPGAPLWGADAEREPVPLAGHQR